MQEPQEGDVKEEEQEKGEKEGAKEENKSGEPAEEESAAEKKIEEVAEEENVIEKKTEEVAQASETQEETVEAPEVTAAPAPPTPTEAEVTDEPVAEVEVPEGQIEPQREQEQGTEVKEEASDEKEPIENHQPGAPQQAWATQSLSESQKVQVKFLVLPQGFSHIAVYPVDIPAVYMYSQLEKDLSVDKATLHISWEGHPFQETDILNEVANIPEQGPLILHLRFDNLPRHLSILSVGEITPGTRNVTIHYGEGIPPKTCTVTLVVAYDKKPFIGGFRNKKTGQIYHHAVGQTNPLEKKAKMHSDKISRETQTKGMTRTVQTVRECATQMARPGFELNTSDDIIIVARPYFTSQQLHGLRVQKSVVIQSHIRGWFARTHAKRLRSEKEEINQAILIQEHKRKEEHETKRQKEIERRTHPRTTQDFTTLYNELETWRLQETRKIKESSMTKEEKQLSLQELLKKETKLLQTIHKLQNAANKENKERRVKSFLESMTAHKKWGAVCACDLLKRHSLEPSSRRRSLFAQNN